MGVQSRFAVMNWFVTGELFPINFVRATIIALDILCSNIESNELHAALNFHCCFFCGARPLNFQKGFNDVVFDTVFAIRRCSKPNGLTKVSKQKKQKSFKTLNSGADYNGAWNIMLDDQYLKKNVFVFCWIGILKRWMAWKMLNVWKPRHSVAPFEIVSLLMFVKIGFYVKSSSGIMSMTASQNVCRKIKRLKSYKSHLLLTIRASNNGRKLCRDQSYSCWELKFPKWMLFSWPKTIETIE